MPRHWKSAFDKFGSRVYAINVDRRPGDECEFMRTDWVIGKGVSAVVVAAAALLIYTQEALPQPANVETAKKEAELLFYVSTRAKDANQISAAFMKKYPFIKASYYRSGSDP